VCVCLCVSCCLKIKMEGKLRKNQPQLLILMHMCPHTTIYVYSCYYHCMCFRDAKTVRRELRIQTTILQLQLKQPQAVPKPLSLILAHSNDAPSSRLLLWKCVMNRKAIQSESVAMEIVNSESSGHSRDTLANDLLHLSLSIERCLCSIPVTSRLHTVIQRKPLTLQLHQHPVGYFNFLLRFSISFCVFTHCLIMHMHLEADSGLRVAIPLVLLNKAIRPLCLLSCLSVS
jgi:hypothetical protein